MEKETELTTSAHLSDNDALLKALQARGGGLMFKLPQLTNVNNNNNNNNDDDDNDVSDMVSLKDWQPAPPSHTQQRPSVVREMSPMEAHLNGIQMKGSVRTRYIPLMEPKKPKEVHKEEVNNNKAPLHIVGAPSKLPSLEVVDEGNNNNNNGHHHHDHTEKEREEEQEEQSDNREPPLIQIHHQHSISLANGIAPEPARGGIAFDISLEDDGMSARSSSRGSSLRVSFVDEVNLGSPSPPRARAPSKSPTRARSGPLSHQQTHNQSHQQSHQSHPTTSGNRPKSNPMPPWESSTKVGPASAPLPKKYVQPTLHGIKVKKGQTTGIKNRLPQPVRNSMPSLEIENEYRSNNNGHHHVDKDGYGGWEHRSGQLVGRSLDSHYFGGGEYDSASKLISSNLVSPVESTREEEPQSQPQPQPRKSSSRPFKTRSNGSHKSSDASSEEEVCKFLSKASFTACDFVSVSVVVLFPFFVFFLR